MTAADKIQLDYITSTIAAQIEWPEPKIGCKLRIQERTDENGCVSYQVQCYDNKASWFFPKWRDWKHSFSYRQNAEKLMSELQGRTKPRAVTVN